MVLDRSTRTCAKNAQISTDHESRTRLVAKLVREVLRNERFTDSASLTEAVKCRCARLKITYDSAVVAEAIDLVGSNVSLVNRKPEGLPEPAVEARPVTRTEAAALLATINQRLGPVRVRTVSRAE